MGLANLKKMFTGRRKNPKKKMLNGPYIKRGRTKNVPHESHVKTREWQSL